MSKPELRVKAIDLRGQGLSYNEILRHVPVAKSTLSLWFRGVGLSQPHKQRLTEKKLEAGRRGGAKVHAERLERARRIETEAAVEAQSRLEEGDLLWLIGVVLYWAEGQKTKAWGRSQKVMFANMDPRAILIMRDWFLNRCSVDESAICYALQIHERADISAAVDFWARLLGLPRGVLRTYLKKHNPLTRRKNAGKGYYGTIRMVVRRSTR